jgi:tripartite-type tricarboxylate transporter receptor subunit TctC
LPNVPTFIEVGYPDIVLRNWTGAAVPAGTPPAMVKRLESAFNEILKMPEYVSAMRKMGGDAKPNSSEEFGQMIAADFKKWNEVSKAAGISID